MAVNGLGNTIDFACDDDQGSGGGEAFGAVAQVERFPNVGSGCCHSRVVEQSAQFSGAALRKPASTGLIAGIHRARVQAGASNKWLCNGKGDALEGLGEGGIHDNVLLGFALRVQLASNSECNVAINS